MRLSMLTIGFLAIGPIALIAAQSKPISTTIARISDSPKSFHEKVVTVSGTVARFQQRTSRAGNDYVTFVLQDSGKSVNVYGRGKLEPPIKNGAKVEIIGVYRTEKKVGDQTFRNEIDISPQKGKPLTVKVLK